jgi:hypothetical protein
MQRFFRKVGKHMTNLTLDNAKTEIPVIAEWHERLDSIRTVLSLKDKGEIKTSQYLPA